MKVTTAQRRVLHAMACGASFVSWGDDEGRAVPRLDGNDRRVLERLRALGLVKEDELELTEAGRREAAIRP